MEQDRDMMVNNMMAITGSDSVSEIIAVLEDHEWNFEVAVQAYLATQIANPSKSATPAAPPRSRGTGIGKRSRDSPDHGTSKRPKREEPEPNFLGEDDENIPAPIPIRRERLIDDHPPAFHVKRIRAPFADFAARNPRRSRQVTQEKVNALGEIFKSPDEILFHGTFDEAKREGNQRRKWILVNILDYQDFQCLCMNRDTWSDSALQQEIKKHFLFWQTDAQLSDDYQRLYPVASFPHTAVLHPTGEQRLYHCGVMSAQEIMAGLKSIIQESPNPFKSAYRPTMDFDEVKATNDLTEEQQLEMAIKASLEKSQEASYEDHSPEFFIISDEDDDFDMSAFDDPDDDNDDSLQILDSPPPKPSKPSKKLSSPPTSKINPVEIPHKSPSPPLSAVEEFTPRPTPHPPTVTPSVERPVSPPKGYTPEKEATCKLRIRMPDGKNINGSFSDQDTVEELFHFVRTHKQASGPVSSGQFTLHTPPQRFLQEEHYSQTLKEAELAPRSVVIVNLT